MHGIEVGERLQVTGLCGQDLGLGTHLFAGKILLDRGAVVESSLCSWVTTMAPPVPPFEVEIEVETRAFEERNGSLTFTGLAIPAGTGTVLIEEIRAIGWNHGQYLAGRFAAQGRTY
jgi:hypothetical protein